MSWITRLRNAAASRRLRRELDEERQFHLEARQQELEAAGLAPAAAAREAERRFGEPLRWREASQEVKSALWLANALADARYALRSLRRRPDFALAAVLVLGLGIGVATAMFSVLEAALLRPLPYPHSNRLVVLAERKAGPAGVASRFLYASAPDARDWQRLSHSFTQIAYYREQRASLELPQQTDVVNDVQTDGRALAVLGLPPRLGRMLAPADATRHQPVAVLSHLLWQTAFHGDPYVVGRTIHVATGTFVVIGVMPASVTYPFGGPVIWTPWAPGPGDDARNNADVHVLARLRAGVSPARAQAEVAGIQARLARQYANLHLPGSAIAERYRDTLAAAARPALLALAAAVALVWLIACVGVSGLLLTRCAVRRRELEVRAALGASRARLAQQLLAEALWLSVAGGILGCVLARAAVSALHAFIAHRIILVSRGIPMDARVLAVLSGLTLLSVLLVGALPAWLSALAPRGASLRAGAVATGGRGQSRLREVLTALELALALVLLVAAGLMLRTLYALHAVRLGFQPENIVTATIQIPPGRFAKRNINTTLDQPLLSRLQSLPGVRAAAMATVAPLQRGFTAVMRFYGMSGRGLPPGKSTLRANLCFVSPEYPEVFGIPLLRGRFFNARRDTSATQSVVVVSQDFASDFYAGENPLGRPLFSSVKRHTQTLLIGVLADARYFSVSTPPGPAIFLSTSQLTPKSFAYEIAANFAQVAVRTQPGIRSASVVPAIRAALHQVAPDLTTGEFSTMRELVAESIGDQTFAAELLSLFALAALAIALVGLHALLAYAVTQRTRELGIRMALGARRGQIMRLVIGRAAWLVAIGLAAGLALALALTRLLQAYLYKVRARDPWTLAAAMAALALAALAAAWFPARRAARLDPLTALREE